MWQQLWHVKEVVGAVISTGAVTYLMWFSVRNHLRMHDLLVAQKLTPPLRKYPPAVALAALWLLALAAQAWLLWVLLSG
jgi:hypothetical protein